MSRKIPCPSCARSLFLPDRDMMPEGKESVLCRRCYCRYNLVLGELTHFSHEVTRLERSAVSSKEIIEVKRYSLRLLCVGYTKPEVYEFDWPSNASSLQLVSGDLVLLVFLPQRNRLLQIYNLSTALNIKIKSPHSDALYSAQVLALAFGLICTGCLWFNKITSFNVALIGSTVLSMGFGYGAFRHLKPKEKDLIVRQKLGTIQDYLQVQHRVELGLKEARSTLKSDKTLVSQLLTLKQHMAAEPQLYSERVQLCDRSILMMEQKKSLLEQQESGFMQVLNMLKVDAMISQITEQLPDAIDQEILQLTEQLETITKQVETLSTLICEI